MIDSNVALNPAQRFVLDAKMLETGFSCVLQLPTGTGKTWLACYAIEHALRRGYRAIYLTPLRALADELFPLWQSRFAPHQVGIFTGDYGQNGKKLPLSFEASHVLIMTPERFDACTRFWRNHWHWIPEVDLVVVDEVHILGDGHRGARLEGAISRFRRLNPFCKFLCLSATLGNREELADWLDGIEYESTWRPVPLTWRIVRYRKADEKPTILAREISQTAASGGRSLVFVQSRRRSETLCHFLQNQGIRADFHHAGLTHASRSSIEARFRTSGIDALISTGTLEMGLNMPVRQVVLYDIQAFDGSRFSPLPVNRIWQRAGRAGRPGLDHAGEAVVMAPTWDRKAERYPKADFERIESNLHHPANLSEQIIAEVGSGLCRSEKQLERAMARSLSAFQRNPLPIPLAVREMIDAGMLRLVQPDDGEEDGDRIRLACTPLGRIATRHLLQPATVSTIRTLVLELPNFTHFDALFVIALTPDCEPIIPVDFEELSALAQCLSEKPAYISWQFDRIREMVHSPSGKRLLSALKTAVMLLTWCDGSSGESVAKQFGVYPFELFRLKESFDRLLFAAVAVSKHVLRNSDPDVSDEHAAKPEATRRLELLRMMVANTLPADVATLTLIKGIGAKWAQDLHHRGFHDIYDLALATSEDVQDIPGLSAGRALQWLLDARELTDEPLPSTEDSAPTFSCTASVDNHSGTRDPYRTRRSIELTVSKEGADGYAVKGGLEPHKVVLLSQQWVCDCADFAKGNLCKHILAVHRHREEAKTDENQQVVDPGYLDLFKLWYEQ